MEKSIKKDLGDFFWKVFSSLFYFFKVNQVKKSIYDLIRKKRGIILDDKRPELFEWVKNISEDIYNIYSRKNEFIKIKYFLYCPSITYMIVTIYYIDCCFLCKHFYDTFKNRRNNNKNSACFIKNNETNEMAIFVIVAKIFSGSYLKKKNVTALYILTRSKKFWYSIFQILKKNKHKYWRGQLFLNVSCDNWSF